LKRTLFLSPEDVAHRWLCDTRYDEDKVYKRITEVDSSVEVDIHGSYLGQYGDRILRKYASPVYKLNPWVFSRSDEDDIIDRIRYRHSYRWDLQSAQSFLSADHKKTSPRPDMFITQPPLKTARVKPFFSLKHRPKISDFALFRKIEAPYGITVHDLVVTCREITEKLKELKQPLEGYHFHYLQFETEESNVLATLEDFEWVSEHEGQAVPEVRRGWNGEPMSIAETEELWKKFNTGRVWEDGMWTAAI
jgi:hypothetical protein